MSTDTQVLTLAHALREVRLVPTLRKEVDDLENRRRELEHAAYQRGRRDAEEVFRDQLHRQRDEAAEVQRRVLDPLRDALPAVIRDSEEALVALCLEAAQKLVAGLPITTEMVEAVVRESLDQLSESTEHHVHLHPEDLDLIERAGSALLRSGSHGQKIAFHPDPEVSRGGCLVKSRFGVLDGRRETKVELLRQTLLP